MFKKIVIIASLLLGVSSMTQAQQTQAWPNRTVKVMVGFQPGGGTDITARVWAKNMSEIWGQPVIIENRPGGGGTLGVKHMLTEPADGYTLSSVQSGTLAPQDVLTKPGFNWLIDLVPVAFNGDAAPFVIVVNSNSKITNMKEFEKWARSKPLNYAYPGIGTPHHLFGALLREHFDTDMTGVPYKGSPQIINDLANGQLDFIVTPSAALIEQNVNVGKFNVIGVFNNRPLPQFPNSMTMSQQGLDGYYVRQFYEIVAPAGTPEAVVRKIRADSKTAWARTFAELRDKGAIDVTKDEYPDSFEKAHQTQVAVWNRIIQKSKIKSLD